MTVGLGHGLLRLAHGEVVADAVRVALLRLFQSFAGEVHAGLRDFDLLLRGSDVEQRVAHVGFDLRVLVAQLRLRGVELRLRLLGLAAQCEFLEQRHAERAGGVHGAVRVRQRGADVAVVGVASTVGRRAAVAALRCSTAAAVCFNQRREIFAIGLGLLDESVAHPAGRRAHRAPCQSG